MGIDHTFFIAHRIHSSIFRQNSVDYRSWGMPSWWLLQSYPVALYPNSISSGICISYRCRIPYLQLGFVSFWRLGIGLRLFTFRQTICSSDDEIVLDHLRYSWMISFKSIICRNSPRRNTPSKLWIGDPLIGSSRRLVVTREEGLVVTPQRGKPLTYFKTMDNVALSGILGLSQGTMWPWAECSAYPNLGVLANNNDNEPVMANEVLFVKTWRDGEESCVDHIGVTT